MSYLHPFEALRRNSLETPQKRAFICPQSSREWTWRDVYEQVSAMGLWLESKGLKTGDRVAILSRNRPEWVMLDLACLGAGLISVPLYPQSIESEINYILKEAEVKLLISEKSFPLAYVTELVPFEKMLKEIESFREKEFEAKLPEPEALATLIYTSGTTGEPKGVMHSARGIYEAVETALKSFPIKTSDRMISYLPLSHVIERILSEFIVLYGRTEVAFIESVERLGKYLPIVQPSVFIAVPRIWDILRFKLEREIESKKFLYLLSQHLPTSIKKSLIGRFVRKKLGLGRARYLLSGAAALHRETAEKLAEFGLLVTEGYGLTETLGVSTFNRVGREVFGSVGSVHEGVKIKICEDGEVALKANFHFLGYYKKPELTAEALKDAWFYTGDVGYLDTHGNLILTDRKKNIFKTSNGKYVAPLPIENKLKAHPMIQEVMVIGENRPHCVALVAVQAESFNEKALLDHLQKVNKELAQHERVHALGCTFGSWSVEAGELTPTLKLKRKQILCRYEKEIDHLYQSRAKIEIFKVRAQERMTLANSGI